MTILPHKVSLELGWTEKLPWQTLTAWCVGHKLQSGIDWDYYSAGVAGTESKHSVIAFKNETDATAFKLRFEL